jgi:hypothetical protein
MVRRTLALALCAALLATGCASASGPRVGQNAGVPMDRAILAEYVQRFPAGSRIRVERTTGGTLRGTLLKTGTDSIIVQRNTRVPEPPVDIPFGTITRVSIDNESSTGRTIGIAVATGVGATFGVLLLLAAIFSAAD